MEYSSSVQFDHSMTIAFLFNMSISNNFLYFPGELIYCSSAATESLCIQNFAKVLKMTR